MVRRRVRKGKKGTWMGGLRKAKIADRGND
jgi:hypothetical protein